MKTLHMKLTMGLAALALAVTALAVGGEGTELTRKVNEYEGQHLGRKVNEYEGQHRSVTGDPSQWG